MTTTHTAFGQTVFVADNFRVELDSLAGRGHLVAAKSHLQRLLARLDLIALTHDHIDLPSS